ncbi:MAG: Fur family transcriptional regulator [Sandaracinaceae bacterium]
MPTTAQLKVKLRDAGLRATSARVAVLSCLLSADAPLTHGEVCERVGDMSFDRATIYRNLTDLTEAGLANRSDLGDHLWRFEAARPEDGADEGVHPHFVCRECGIVSCLPDGAIAVRFGPAVPRSVRAAEVEVQLRGVCNACA